MIMNKGASAPNILTVIFAERQFNGTSASSPTALTTVGDRNATHRRPLSKGDSAEHPNLHPKGHIPLGYARL